MRRLFIGIFLLLIGFSLTPFVHAQTQIRRIYIANDDHTDYMWTANEATYKNAFISMLDYYVNQANTTASNPPEYQGKFSADGNFWLFTYEKNKTATEFNTLMSKVKDGHINVPLNALVSTYGGQPLEGILRGMYYAGRLERRYNTRFLSALAMENQVLPFGLGTVYAGAGAKYSWHGVCGCASALSNFSRPNSIYSWKGLDGSNILMKWHNFSSNDSLGGYAESRYPSTVVDLADSQLYSTAYPYGIIGAFGKGWDDLQTQTNEFITTAQSKTTSSRQVYVSNEIDFFKDFDSNYGSSLPQQSLSFGSEWDHALASLAEVSARVKRAVEKLRTAEGLAAIVSLKSPTFMDSRISTRDLAFEDLGLYWEHDFGSGGSVGVSARTTFERRLATEIESYINTLQSDAVTALSGMIQKSGTNQRFFVYNPLSWVRSDYADVTYTGPTPIHVIDLSTNLEVPSQIVTISGVQNIRILAPSIPSVGYKVFEIQSGSGTTYPQAATVTGNNVIENQYYKLTISSAGAITSLIDKSRSNREMVRQVNTRYLNDLGGGSGTLSIENAGPVSVTIKAVATTPLSHTTRITMYKDSNRIEIQNEITQNFGTTQSYGFGFNLDSPDVWHEEEGAVIRAKLSSAGGHYATRNARYDWIALNHFADMTSSTAGVGVTLSNADSSFMNLGNSSVTTFDTTTPYLAALAGGQIDSEITNQGGDTYFMNRYALQTHDAYNQVNAMKFALEHQNPFVANMVTGGTSYPSDTYSLVNISNPNVLLWSVKPAEEGIAQGIITRVWNMSGTPQTFTMSLPSQTITSAKNTTNIETDLSDETVTGGALSSSITQQQTKSYRLFSTVSTTTPTTGPSPTPSVSLGNGDTNGDGIVSIADIKLVLQNWLASLTSVLDQYGDGRINAFDFTRVVQMMPQPSATPTTAPSVSQTPTPTPAGNPTPTASPQTLRHVQSTLANTPNLVTSYPASFPNAVTSGDLVVVAVSSWNSTNTSNVTSITDNKGNTYTKVVEDPSPVTGAVEPLSIWYAKNVTGGTGVIITATLQSAASLTIAIHEYAGVDTLTPVDSSQHQTGTATLATSGTIATTQATELLFGASNHQSATTTATAGTGFTLRQSQNDNDCCEALYTEDQIVSATGSFAATFTYATSVNYRAGIVAFKAAP